MVTDPRCKSGKNCGTHSIIYTAKEDGQWKPFTQFDHGTLDRPHEELYPVATIQIIEGHKYLRCVWQCDDHITSVTREMTDEQWNPPYRLDIQGDNLANPAIVSYDMDEYTGRTVGFCTETNAEFYSLLPFYCDTPPLKVLSRGEKINNGSIIMKDEFPSTGNEQRRGSVDLSNIELSGDKEYDMQGALWLTTHSYIHSEEMIAFSQEYTPGKLEDWLGTEAFTVGTDDSITMNNQFSLVDFSATEVDSVLSTPLFLIDVYDAQTQQSLLLDELTLGNIVALGTSDTVIQCNSTIALNGWEGRTVRVRVRLVGQREHLREPAWTEIIYSEDSSQQRAWSKENGAGSLSNIPKEFSLSQNYPNPFNPVTVIRYQLPVNSFVTLKVFDLLGREIATLVNSEQEAGYKSVNFDASKLSSGIYIYKLVAGSFIDVKKMLLLK
jgi:hypothetical protein